MSKSIPGNQKHITMDNRVVIEKGLNANLSLRSIAIQLGKDPTTIAKEIKNTDPFRNTTTTTSRKTNAYMPETAKRKILAESMLPFVKELAGSVTSATPTVLTLRLAVITVTSWTRLPY